METIIVKYKGFEILCKPRTVEKYRDGNLGIDNVVVTDDIYTNVKKGDKAKDSDILKEFGSNNTREIIEQMVKLGSYTLTVSERKEKTELKKREILGIVHKSVIDPKLGVPHPMVRLEAIMNEVKFNVDYEKGAKKQAEDLIKKMIGVIPIKRMEPIKATLTIPHKSIGKVQNIIPGLVTSVMKTNYTQDGCVMDLSMLPSDLDNLTNALNKLIQDNYEFNVTSSSDFTSPSKSVEEIVANGKINKNKKGGKGKNKRN